MLDNYFGKIPTIISQGGVKNNKHNNTKSVFYGVYTLMTEAEILKIGKEIKANKNGIIHSVFHKETFKQEPIKGKPIKEEPIKGKPITEKPINRGNFSPVTAMMNGMKLSVNCVSPHALSSQDHKPSVSHPKGIVQKDLSQKEYVSVPRDIFTKLCNDKGIDPNMYIQ